MLGDQDGNSETGCSFTEHFLYVYFCPARRDQFLDD